MNSDNDISPTMKSLLSISNQILKTYDTNNEFNAPEKSTDSKLSTLMNRRESTLKEMMIKRINPYILSVNNKDELIESFNTEKIPYDLLELIKEHHDAKHITIAIDAINTPYLPKILTLGTNVTYHDPIENGGYHSHDVTLKVKRIIADIYNIQYYDEWDSTYRTIWYSINALWNKNTGEYCFYKRITNHNPNKLNSIILNIFGDSHPLEIKEWNKSTSVYLSKSIGRDISISDILGDTYENLDVLINDECDDDWLRYDDN